MKAALRLFLALPSFVLGACGPEEVRPPVTPPATPLGAPESCVPLNRLGQSFVRDDWTIDFVSDNGRVWRNSLSQRCPGLKVNHAFTYETSLSQLCSTDLIYVLESTDRLRRGAACGLGAFVPVMLEKPHEST